MLGNSRKSSFTHYFILQFSIKKIFFVDDIEVNLLITYSEIDGFVLFLSLNLTS